MDAAKKRAFIGSEGQTRRKGDGTSERMRWGPGVARGVDLLLKSPRGTRRGRQAAPRFVSPSLSSLLTAVLFCFSAPQAPPASVRCRMAPLPMRWTSREGNSRPAGASLGDAPAAGARTPGDTGGGTGLTRREREHVHRRLARVTVTVCGLTEPHSLCNPRP